MILLLITLDGVHVTEPYKTGKKDKGHQIKVAQEFST